MPSLSTMVRPKLSEMRMAWVLSGQASLTISRVVARWGLAGRVLEAVRLSGAMIGILSDDVSEAEMPVLIVRIVSRCGRKDMGNSGPGQGQVTAKASEAQLRMGRATHVVCDRRD